MPRVNRNKDCTIAEGGHLVILPAGTPNWITSELVEKTISVWQPFYKTVLTPEEAITMILNVGRLYGALSSGSSS